MIQFLILPLLLFIVCIKSPPLRAQSLATNILFEQASAVYKGRVMRIQYIDSGGSGDHYTIWTEVEKSYKNYWEDKPVGINTTRLYEVDTLLAVDTLVDGFQVSSGDTYVFFVQRLNEWSTGVGADLVDNHIEAIPFSETLAAELERFDNMSFTTTNTYGPLPFKLLCQASPVVTPGRVTKISQQKDGYLVEIRVPAGETWRVKMPQLHCICAKGQIQEAGDYLFFLTPYAENSYLLTDRYLGVFQWFAKWRLFLNEKQSKN